MSMSIRWLAAVVSAVAVAGATVPLTASADCTPGFRNVATGGFGNRFNLYAWSMQVFKGRLFVGTMNQVTGGEILAFDGASWQRVLQQNLARTGNTGFRNMIVFNGYLYAGGTNDRFGAELWRSPDGVQWRKIVSGGFGDRNNNSLRGLVIFRDKLYVGLQNASGSGAQLWRSSNGLNFEPVSTNGLGDTSNVSFHNMAVFRDQLYIGTKNQVTLAQIWRTSDGAAFEQVVGPNGTVPGGFGVPGNFMTMSMYVNKNVLYIGTGNAEDDGDPLRGFSVMRTSNGTKFQPITTNGGGDVDNRFAWRFLAYEDQLWLGTGNFNIEGGEGGQLLRSATGSPGTWQTMVGPASPYGFTYGFGNPMNWGIRTLAEYQGKLYVGTAQCWEAWCQPNVTGAEVWEWSGEACPAKEPPALGVPAR